MSINWLNPYSNNSGKWFKGSLHNHCEPASPCASMSQEVLLDGYETSRYDFLSISDHLALTIPKHPPMSFIPGMEWNSRTGQIPDQVVSRYDHVGIYGLDPAQVAAHLKHRSLAQVMACGDEGILKIANHPDWLIEEHHSMETLLRFGRKFNGMEIYNYTLEFDDGQADTTWKWDRLLSIGIPLLGFASDDSHQKNDIGHAWLMVRSKDNGAPSIFQAIQEGNFYCSTGATITNLTRHQDTLSITLNQEAMIRVIGSQGRVLATHHGESFQWNFSSATTDYARFHILAGSWQQAWSQPFFRNSTTLNAS